jgi:hypothetical protein
VNRQQLGHVADHHGDISQLGHLAAPGQPESATTEAAIVTRAKVLAVSMRFHGGRLWR